MCQQLQNISEVFLPRLPPLLQRVRVDVSDKQSKSETELPPALLPGQVRPEGSAVSHLLIILYSFAVTAVFPDQESLAPQWFQLSIPPKFSSAHFPVLTIRNHLNLSSSTFIIEGSSRFSNCKVGAVIGVPSHGNIQYQSRTV